MSSWGFSPKALGSRWVDVMCPLSLSLCARSPKAPPKGLAYLLSRNRTQFQARHGLWMCEMSGSVLSHSRVVPQVTSLCLFLQPDTLFWCLTSLFQEIETWEWRCRIWIWNSQCNVNVRLETHDDDDEMSQVNCFLVTSFVFVSLFLHASSFLLVISLNWLNEDRSIYFL